MKARAGPEKSSFSGAAGVGIGRGGGGANVAVLRPVAVAR
jgi:hypothetical protein